MVISVQSLSHSTVTQFMNCPEKVWFDKIEREPAKQQNVALVNGISLHAAAQSWFQAQKEKIFLTKEVLQRIYTITFYNLAKRFEIVYGSKSREEIQAKAFGLIELLMKQDVGEVVGVEVPVAYELTPSVTFIGRLDLITRNQKGELVIWELKSSAKSYGIDELRKACEQLLLYSYGIREPSHLKVMTLVKTKIPKIDTFDLNPVELHVTYDELLERFCMVQKAIENGIHYCNRGWQCNGCGFSHICSTDQRNSELDFHFVYKRRIA